MSVCVWTKASEWEGPVLEEVEVKQLSGDPIMVIFLCRPTVHAPVLCILPRTFRLHSTQAVLPAAFVNIWKYCRRKWTRLAFLLQEERPGTLVAQSLHLKTQVKYRYTKAP